MESNTPWLEADSWSVPEWFESHLIPDDRFAKAYNALADDRRALLKGLVARHYALNQPRAALATVVEERFGLFVRNATSSPAPLVLLLNDGHLDAPAFFLAALLPALCASVGQVLVVRLGKQSAVPNSFLVACELSGQESVAVAGPLVLQRLLADCAASGAAHVVLYPDTPGFRKLFAQKELRATLDASPLRFVALKLPLTLGLWRDEAHQFPLQDMQLLYGDVRFEIGGAHPLDPSSPESKLARRNRPQPDEAAWEAFCAVPRQLLLAPDARVAKASALVNAKILVAESCHGQWRWPELWPGLFCQRSLRFSPAP